MDDKHHYLFVCLRSWEAHFSKFIRIHHEYEGGIEKCVPKHHQLASRGLLSDDKRWLRGKDFSLDNGPNFNITMMSAIDIRPVCSGGAAVHFLSSPQAGTGMRDRIISHGENQRKSRSGVRVNFLYLSPFTTNVFWCTFVAYIANNMDPDQTAYEQSDLVSYGLLPW